MDQAKPDKHNGRFRPWKRFSRNTLIVLGIAVVLLLAVRLALPAVLRSAINSRLQKIPDYRGSVDEVGVSLYRGAYTLHGLVIRKRSGEITEPFFSVRKIDFSVAWRELFHGQLVSDIEMEQPKLTLVAASTDDGTQLAMDHRWQDAMNDIFPIDITWLKITDGQVRYVNRTTQPKVDVRIGHLRAMATDLRNRATPASGEFPSTIVLEGETIGGGRLKIAAQLEPLAIDPHFLVKLELEKVSLPALNEFLLAYGGVDASKGEFNLYVEAVAREGRYKGYFKPFFDQVDFSNAPEKHTNLKKEVWEWFVSSFAWIFKNHTRDEVATKIPFSGEVKGLDLHKWETFKNLVRHAFIEPFQQKLDSKAAGGVGAKDEKGLLPKAEEKK